MKTTVITWAYGEEAMIADVLRLVMEHDNPDVEHIVADGLSIDGTLGIVREFVYLYWKTERDQGIYDVMNKGVAWATGDVVSILERGRGVRPSQGVGPSRRCFGQKQRGRLFHRSSGCSQW